MSRRIVLLPLPLWPRMTRRSCGSTRRKTPSSTFFSSNCMCTSRISTLWGRVVFTSERTLCKQCCREYRRRSNAGRAAFDRQTAETGNRCDEQTEHKAFQDAGNEVANEEGIAYQIE